jgi:very-short-patch-repair endonuclease
MVRSNIGNDRRCDAYCEQHGWTVLRFWEHDLLNNPDACAEKIRAAVTV